MQVVANSPGVVGIHRPHPKAALVVVVIRLCIRRMRNDGIGGAHPGTLVAVGKGDIILLE